MRFWTGLSLVILSGFLTTVGLASETYSGKGAKGPTSGYKYTLTLAEEGQAQLKTVYSRRNRMSAMAVWRMENQDEVVVQFINREGTPRGGPTVWRQSGRQLTPLRWDKKEWTEAAPPVLRRD